MDPITLFGAAVAAIIIGQGGHQQDGYRDTGCDISQRVEVRSERTGEVLYSYNPGCSGVADARGGNPLSREQSITLGRSIANANGWNVSGSNGDMNGAPE